MRITFIASIFFLSILISPPALFAGGGGEPIETHWLRPFTVSGAVDSKGLEPYPESCRACHSSQFESWTKSLHSGSMSPGLLMQIEANIAPAFVNSCKFCHAPAIEQSEVIERGESNGQSETVEADSAFISNPDYDERLASSGVSCAICHLRKGVVYGPPGSVNLSGEPPHESIESSFFESSEFCAACHQMDRGYELRGKVLTNTYREWKESSYAKDNITCQKCHMPDRRHEFRGIHDPEMVRSGLDIKLIRVPANSGVKAALTIKNARVGHRFPTYVTPIVVIKAFMKDANGEVIKDSTEKGFIGRLVSQDLKTEYFDTRLKPHQTFTFDYDTNDYDALGAKTLVFSITVRPDEFYDRMFKRAIEHGKSGFIEAHLKEASRRTGSSSYVLFAEEIEIGE